MHLVIKILCALLICVGSVSAQSCNGIFAANLAQLRNQLATSAPVICIVPDGNVILDEPVVLSRSVVLRGLTTGVEIFAGTSNRIFHANTGGVTITLENLILRNGNAGSGNGGCILAASDVKFIMNNVKFNNCTTSNGNGGAIAFADNNELTMNNVDFTNNIADDPIPISEDTFPFYGHGGAIDIRSRLKLTCTNCKFEDNSAKAFGGVIFDHDGGSKLVFTNSHFKRNSAFIAGVMELSAGPFRADSKTKFVNVIFQDNIAVEGFPGVSFMGGVHVMTDVSFIDNVLDNDEFVLTSGPLVAEDISIPEEMVNTYVAIGGGSFSGSITNPGRDHDIVLGAGHILIYDSGEPAMVAPVPAGDNPYEGKPRNLNNTYTDLIDFCTFCQEINEAMCEAVPACYQSLFDASTSSLSAVSYQSAFESSTAFWEYVAGLPSEESALLMSSIDMASSSSLAMNSISSRSIQVFQSSTSAVDWQSANPDSNEGEEGLSMFVIIGAAGGGAVLLVTLSVIFSRKSRKPRRQTLEMNNMRGSRNGSMGSNQSSAFIYDNGGSPMTHQPYYNNNAGYGNSSMGGYNNALPAFQAVEGPAILPGLNPEVVNKINQPGNNRKKQLTKAEEANLVYADVGHNSNGLIPEEDEDLYLDPARARY